RTARSTLAPARTKAVALARPRPRLARVMIAERPVRSITAPCFLADPRPLHSPRPVPLEKSARQYRLPQQKTRVAQKWLSDGPLLSGRRQAAIDRFPRTVCKARSLYREANKDVW